MSSLLSLGGALALASVVGACGSGGPSGRLAAPGEGAERRAARGRGLPSGPLPWVTGLKRWVTAPTVVPDADRRGLDWPGSRGELSGRDGGTGTRPDAGPPPSGPYPNCPEGRTPLVGGGTAGPIELVREQGHGLPGCYRCSLDVADFDADGRPDVVMAGPFDSAWVPGMGNYTYQNVVRLYANASCPGQELRFTLVSEVPGVSGGGGALVRVGDFDGDGRPDYAVQFREGDSPASDTSAFLNGGGWSFQRRVLARGFDTNSTSMGMAVGDFDQDGRDDLAFNSDGYGAGPGLWYSYDPALARWSAQQADFSHHIAYGGSIVAGDLNGDGYPDIVVSGNSSQPFGSYDCSSTLMYGQIHLNKGPSARPRGIDPNALDALGRFALRSGRAPGAGRCTGADNASVALADVDADGHLDIILAGSADAFGGPPGMNGSQYDFVVLRNVDGSGDAYVTFENAGQQLPNGTTNGGAGNLDLPSIATGDLDGDGYLDVFIQGHHRDYAHDPGAYVFETPLFHGVGGTRFEELDLGLPDVGEGGQAMADFNLDGKVDLLFAGATLPWHSNGSNPTDRNDASTLRAYVYRNVRR